MHKNPSKLHSNKKKNKDKNYILNAKHSIIYIAHLSSLEYDSDFYMDYTDS